MLSKLVSAAAQGSKHLLKAVTASGSKSAGATLTLTQGASQACQQTASRLAWRGGLDSQAQCWRAYSAAEAPLGNKSHSILEKTVEAQMQKVMKSKPDTAAQQGATPASRILGVLVDSLALGLGGLIIFAGYYSLAYKSSSDLEDLLTDAKESLRLAEAAESLPSTDQQPQSAPASQASNKAVQPAAFPPLTQAWCKVMERYIGLRKYVEKSVRDYQDPTYHKLLPDMAPELRGRIKTLVLDLDDLLVHKEWTRQAGWKIYKRPGVQDFLLEMGGYYELVIFTDATASYAEPIISKLDPHRVVMYRLFRPETQYHNGKHVRDLSKLNRDLSQVLLISSNPDAWEFQPENTIKLKPWIKDTTDTTLLDLIPMLQLVATKGVKDVRDVVRSYDGEEDVAKAFKTRMAQIAEHQKQPQKRGLLSGFK